MSKNRKSSKSDEPMTVAQSSWMPFVTRGSMESENRVFSDLISSIQSRDSMDYKPKSGGAKNAGEYTGNYKFNTDSGTRMMLFKQGSNVGETISETVTANLMRLDNNDNVARSFFVRPRENNTSLKSSEAYTVSVYEKLDASERIQEGFELGGKSARPRNARSLQPDFIKAILNANRFDYNHSLESVTAKKMLLGDNDAHSANFVAINNKDDPSKNRMIAIDTGGALLNLQDKVPNIDDAIAVNPLQKDRVTKAKVFGVKIAKPTLVPTNHFWDWGVNNNEFYKTEHFHNAVESAISFDSKSLLENMQQSLDSAVEAYQDSKTPPMQALKDFAKWINMPKSEIKDAMKNNNISEFKQAIISFTQGKLSSRAVSMNDMRHDLAVDALKEISQGKLFHIADNSDVLNRIHERHRHMETVIPERVEHMILQKHGLTSLDEIKDEKRKRQLSQEIKSKVATNLIKHKELAIEQVLQDKMKELKQDTSALHQAQLKEVKVQLVALVQCQAYQSLVEGQDLSSEMAKQIQIIQSADSLQDLNSILNASNTLSLLQDEEWAHAYVEKISSESPELDSTDKLSNMISHLKDAVVEFDMPNSNTTKENSKQTQVDSTSQTVKSSKEDKIDRKPRQDEKLERLNTPTDLKAENKRKEKTKKEARSLLKDRINKRKIKNEVQKIHKQHGKETRKEVRRIRKEVKEVHNRESKSDARSKVTDRLRHKSKHRKQSTPKNKSG